MKILKVWNDEESDALFQRTTPPDGQPAPRVGLTRKEEALIRGWLDYIREDDIDQIEGVIAQARQNPECREFYLRFAKGQAFTYRPGIDTR